MTTKNLFAPHAAVIAVMSTLDTNSEGDAGANKRLCEAIGQMKLAPDHVADVQVKLAELAAETTRKSGAYVEQMVNDIDETIDRVAENHVKSGNGIGDHGETVTDPIAAAATQALATDQAEVTGVTG